MKMCARLYLTTFTLAAVFAPLLLSEETTNIPPIKEIKGVNPEASVFKAASASKPIVIKSEDDAAKHFAENAVADLKKQVDFKNQIVLVFAWRGSGQDKLNHIIAESFPEQITFTRVPGRTRDLRPHVHVYALRSNVKWMVRGN
jgi:hypothetical protein